MTIEEQHTDEYKLSELNIIGALLINPEAIEEVVDTLKPEMFYNSILGTAYDICYECYLDNKSFDASVLNTEILRRMDNLDEQTVFEVIKDCASYTSTSASISHHSEIVKTNYAKRLVKSYLVDVSNNPEKSLAIASELNDKLSSLEQGDRSYKSLAQISEQYEGEHFCDKETSGLTMGIADFDDVLGELEGGDLIVIGARPAVGKSALASQIVNNLAHNKKRIGYFNLEMTEKQVFERFLANESGIGLTRIRRAIRFMGDEQEKYDKAMEHLKKKDSIIIPTGSKSPSQIRGITKKERFDCIVVDYLQLVKPEGRYRGNRYAEVGEISHALKGLATELNIPVIVLTQLNRVSEGKMDKEPDMGEIRESGDIEQDASIIILLWNKDEDDRTRKGYKIPKNRQGTLKKGELKFDGDRMRFYCENENPKADNEGFVEMDSTFENLIPFM